MSNITLKSFPFDSLEVLNTNTGQMEDDRLYQAEIFRGYFAKFLSNGVYYGDYKNYKEKSMKVELDGGLNIRVLAGAGLINGVDYENEKNQIFTLDRPASGSRKDRVVVKLDSTLSVRETQLYIKQGKGTTGATLQRDENIHEICLAEVTVKSSSNLTANDIKDTRIDKNLCGIVNSLISVDGEELYSRFKEYIATLEKQLDSKMNNIMLKNQDNICTGKITANKGFEGNLKGDVSGNATTATKANTATTADTSKNCTGNSNTATTANTSKACTRK